VAGASPLRRNLRPAATVAARRERDGSCLRGFFWALVLEAGCATIIASCVLLWRALLRF
jgi:hypothetical protein